MKDHEDHFKFFITDDKTYDKYIEEMKEDGIWGGNLELTVKKISLILGNFNEI